ncbi:MAG: HD-GYP domain-containing protein [Desulfobacterales bacterium]|nr:HD-GYP domain-containing protein [Desulfobacterales bacterium]
MNNKDSADKALYSSRIVDNYIKLINKQYSFINVEELLNYAGMEAYQVEDEGHWFSQNQINKFQEKLSELTNNKSIAREAGAFAASPNTLGTMRRYILGLIGPQNAYELVGKYASKFTKSATFSSKRISSNKVEIIVKPNKGVTERPFQCENRLGFFDAISSAFNYSLPEIKHPECIFEEGSVCRYSITWQKSLSANIIRFRNYISIFFFILAIVVALNFSKFILGAYILLCLTIISFMNFFANRFEVEELKKALENLSRTSEDLIEQVNINYENSLMINEIGQALSKENDLDGVLSQVLGVLEDRLDYDRGLILLANKEKTRLISRSGFGYSVDDLSKFMMSSGFHLDKKNSKGVFINCFNQQKPFLINNIDEIKDELSERSLQFASVMGVKSFICCPIIFEKESLGVLAVDNIMTKRTLVESDINILMGIAPQVAVSIHNIKLVEGRLKQFQSILQTLVASTEARDPITAGHSEKVTEYAVGICQQLQLPVDYTDMIRVSASLHDYGKIGVDDSILKKPGKLNDEEYEHIKTHALKTQKILQQVNFEGVYKEVPEIAASHHEKLDGTGYPKGLTGDEIPFGGKIIAVADVFEALTSRRHYRDPMPGNEALDHLVNNIDIHFEKSCVEAFITYYNSNISQIPYIPKGNFIMVNND